MPASPLSGSAPARTILTPLYCLGLCEAVICAPPSSPSSTTAKYSMSVRHHAVVDDVGALLAHAFDERRGQRRRRHAHVARDADALAAEIGGEAAADLAGHLFVDLAGIEAADVVGLEDGGIDHVMRSGSS